MYLEKKKLHLASAKLLFYLPVFLKKKLILNPLSKYLLTYLNQLLPQS